MLVTVLVSLLLRRELKVEKTVCQTARGVLGNTCRGDVLLILETRRIPENNTFGGVPRIILDWEKSPRRILGK